jgi:hypothetical protein
MRVECQLNELVRHGRCCKSMRYGGSRKLGTVSVVNKQLATSVLERMGHAWCA